MSNISKLSVYTHCNELGGKVWNPAIKWTEKHAVFVVLEDSNGQTGLGECWCFDASPDALVAFLRTEVAPHIIGISVEEHASTLQSLYAKATLSARHGMLASALSGVDIALWDLRSKLARQPLWKYLRSQGLQSDLPDGCVYLYGSGGLYGEDKTNEDLSGEMLLIQSEGFDLVKMKVGGLPAAEDRLRVEAVLDKLPKACKLIIDGVYTYSMTDAQAFYDSLSSDRIVAFQSPVDATDAQAMKQLTESGMPVMGTEAEYRHEIHRELINEGAVKFLQVAPIACGGLSRLIELNELLSDSRIYLSLEVSSTAVALLAASHFAAASESVAHTEYHYVHQVFFEHLDLRAIRGNQGWFQLPAGYGLGIDLPLSQLNAEFSLPLSS